MVSASNNASQPSGSICSAMQPAFAEGTPGVSHLSRRTQALSPRARPRLRPVRRRPRVSASSNGRDGAGSSGGGDDDGDDDPELSRRGFFAVVAATSLATALVGYRFVIGEDVEDLFLQRVAARFPSIFPRELRPDERRLPTDPAFVAAYYAALERVAREMRIISPADLHRDEAEVRQRAESLFFHGAPESQSLTNAEWLNYVLYSRLHVIAERTSPKSRREFTDRLARATFDALKVKPLRLTGDDARSDSARWLAQIRGLLDELTALGWVSGYRIEQFDDSLWQDEGHAPLTVYTYDPVTIQAAQLLGEEQSEDISPTLSGVISEILTAANIKVSLDTYYLDDKYRPDPSSFTPTQLVTQFDLYAAGAPAAGA